MSTADFHPVLVRDRNLCFSDNLPYACYKGAQNNSIQRLQANSESSSAIIWNVVTPSETVALNRHVLWEGTVTIMNQLYIASVGTAGPNVPANVNAMSLLGAGDANAAINGTGSTNIGFTPLGSTPFQEACTNMYNVNGPSAFPLHSTLNTMQATLNNQTVSNQIRDLLPFLETVNSHESSEYINSLCPHQRDSMLSIADNNGFNNNPYGSYEKATVDFTGNGSYNLKYYYVDVVGAPTVVVPINNTTTLNVNTLYTIIIKITSSEPILMSPFVFAKDMQGSAMYGLQQMNLTLNVGAANRVWRTSIPNAATTSVLTSAVSGGNGGVAWIGNGFQYVSGYSGFQPFENDYLHLNYLTPFPSQLLSSRCVVPYMQLARYITPVSNPAIAAIANGVIPNTLPEFSTTLQAINLASLPDKIGLCIRYKNSLKTNQDADWNAVINKVTISWNNSQGLLSSANIYDLYKMSLEAGSNLTYPEFSGVVNQNYSISKLPAGRVATLGSMLILDIGKHLALDSDWFAPGSLATTQVLITVNYAYQSALALPADSLEAVLYTVDSGLLVNERGTTATYIGILSKQQVLETSASEEYYNDGDIHRIVGGSFWGSLKSGLSSVWNAVKPVISTVAPIAKTVLGSMGNPAAQTASNVLGALGYGQSGGMKRRIK